MELTLILNPEQAARYIRLATQEGESHNLAGYAIELLEGCCDELLDDGIDGEIEDFLEV